MRLKMNSHPGTNTSRSGNVKPRARLFLEQFEERCLPSGATLTVNTLVDMAGNSGLSLREAVAISQGAIPTLGESTQINGNPAGGNDTIVFSTGLKGTISLALGELNAATALSENVTITGPGSSLLAVKGVGTQILNNGTAGISLTITGLTFEDGFNGGPGGAILNDGVLTLTDDLFSDNESTTGGGGAIAEVSTGGSLNVTGTTFTGNSSTGSGGGGAIFSPGAGTTLTIASSTFTNNSEADAGAGGGAILNSGAGNPLTITKSNFTDNTAMGTGGAIDSDAASQLVLSNSAFTGNSALNGGAVAANNSAAQTISVTDSTFSKNNAIGGTEGGGALEIQGNSSTITISGSTFTQNLTDSTGGAISSGFNTGGSGTGEMIVSSTFTGNMAKSLAGAVEGGAFFDTNTPKLSIADSSFTGNSATSSTTGQGGALSLEVSGTNASPVLFANVKISGNKASTAGGGVYVTSGTIFNLSYSQITANTALDGGGLDVAANSVVTLGQSTVSGNIATAGGSGGGIFNVGTFNLEYSTVSGNTSGGVGGGIFSNSPLSTNLTVINSTVANNIATIGAGGGIFSDDVGAVLVNSTIVLNKAGGGGGGFYEDVVAGVTLTNTIVARNTSAGAASDIGGSTVVSTSENNLIGTGGSGGLTKTNGNQVGVSNPGLNPIGLENNGGPTLTIALAAGSPALNTGSTSVLSSPYDLTTDQRGYTRSTGTHLDIGAFESGAVNVTPVVTASAVKLAATATTLVIHGIGFSSVAANNTVAFTSSSGVVTTGTVTSATTTTLTVTGLSGLTGGILSAKVTSNGHSGDNTAVATVLPVVTKSTAFLGANATSLIIYGFGFNPTASNDTVTLSGGLTCTVISATANELTLDITGTLKLGSLTALVTVGGVSSGIAVEVSTVRPTVALSSADLSPDSTTLVIYGSGFSTDAAHNTVVFSNGTTGTVTSATATTLTLTALKDLTAGNLTAIVTSNDVSSGPEVEVANVT